MIFKFGHEIGDVPVEFSGSAADFEETSSSDIIIEALEQACFVEAFVKPPDDEPGLARQVVEEICVLIVAPRIDGAFRLVGHEVSRLSLRMVN